MTVHFRLIAIAGALLIALLSSASSALEPDQLLLIVNKNSKESRELAEFYAKARLIPDGRIVELDLPTTDEIPFADYDQLVAIPLRQFLRANQIQQKVTCLVSFYGVPLRISDKRNTPEDIAELARLKTRLAKLERMTLNYVDQLEKIVISVEKDFKPSKGVTIIDLAKRADAALSAIRLSMIPVSEIQRKEIIQKRVNALSQLLAEPIEYPELAATQPATTVPTTIPGNADIEELTSMRFDPQARIIHRMVSGKAGTFEYGRLLQTQIEYFTTELTSAAFDSELTLIWWPGYTRSKWQLNILGYQFAGHVPPGIPPVMMVTRLDAPEPAMVRRMILDSLRAEKDGLQGRFVVDPGGAAKLDPARKNPAIWKVDEVLTSLAQMTQKHTKLAVVFEPKPDILPADSVKDAAMYCGWYNVGQYVPSVRFVTGGIGVHIGSYEMTSLHDNNNHGWCRGMIKDGAAVVLGPVAEPYLAAFPMMDEFYGILLTGKYTLAEAYFKTNPMLSWQMCLVGDPLYNPFKTNPAISVDNLSERARVGLAAPVVPSSQPR